MRVTPGPVSGGHTYLIERASFSPDGERFVSGDLNGGLMMRTRSGEITAKLCVPSRYSKPEVRAVAWSPDGSRIAVHEHGSVRLRRPADLAEEAEAKSIGKGPLAFGGGGRWLAVLSQSSLSVLGVPAFDELGSHWLSRESFEYFSADQLAADPHGSLIAAADDGGCDETAMGVRTRQGEPQVTLIDAERRAKIGAIERGHPIVGLEFDPWRGRLLTVSYGDVGAWSRTGDAITRFAPYPNSFARSLAVSERWIATAPGTGDRARIDFFDPETYERLETVDLPRPVPPSWIAASPDGRAFVTPEIPQNRDFAVRIWTVEGAHQPHRGPGRIQVTAAILSSPEQLPDIAGPSLVLTWDQDEADSIVTNGDTVVWRERTGWEVYERFGEIAAILQRKYGVRLKDLVPAPGSEWALYGDTSRAFPHVRSIRAQLASGERVGADATQKRDAEILELAYIQSGQRGDAPLDVALRKMADYFAGRIEQEVAGSGAIAPIHQSLPELENGGYIALDLKALDGAMRALELRVESPSGENKAVEVVRTGTNADLVRFLRSAELPDELIPLMERLTDATRES